MFALSFALVALSLRATLAEWTHGSLYSMTSHARSAADVTRRVIVTSLSECSIRCQVDAQCAAVNVIARDAAHSECEMISEGASGHEVIDDQKATYMGEPPQLFACKLTSL